MPYAIRYNSAQHDGMLIEITAADLRAAEAAQIAARDRIDAYWDTPDCSRPHVAPEPHPYPHFWHVSAQHAHKWVRDGNTHETALYVDDGRIRRASEGEA